MGQGIEMARAGGADAHADVLDNMKDQLLIVLMKRLAKEGKVVIPVAEVDNTGNDLLSFQILGMGTPNAAFNFVLGKKQ